MSAAANSVRSVSSRLRLRADRRTTCSSDLLSNGSSFTVTALVQNSAQAAASRRRPRAGISRRALAAAAIGVATAAIERGRAALRRARRCRIGRGGLAGASRSISHGATTMATKNENSIAAEALAGIGRHVGPHQPGHEQHRQQRRDHGQRRDDGRIADFGHRLDRRLHARLRPSRIAQWRAMFSTTTMASSTRMPIEKISANRLTRLIV